MKALWRKYMKRHLVAFILAVVIALGVTLFPMSKGKSHASGRISASGNFQIPAQDSPDVKEKEILTRKQALIVAEASEEVRYFYDLYDGRLRKCIEANVVRPCETDWVTCIEDAWVVEFIVGKTCPVEHDGRLGVRLLIDEQEGKILSRFPEADYFKEKQYCLEDYDCVLLSNQETASQKCYNFIHGQLLEGEISTEQACICQDHRCAVKLSDPISPE